MLKPMRQINAFFRSLPVWLRRPLLALSLLTLGTALAALLLNAFGAKATVVVSLIGDVVFLACAWLGYLEGVLAVTLITFVVPHLLLPRARLHPDVGRFGILLVLSLLVSSISAYKRKAARALKFAADELESRVQSRTLELQRALEQIQASELRFRLLADSMPQIVWTASENGSIEYLNRQWYEFIQSQSVEGLTKDIQSLVHPDDRQRYLDGWRSAVAANESYEAEIRLADGRTGGYRWFLCRGLFAVDPFSSVRWFGTFTDINQQKITERDLHQANGELRQFAYAAAHDMQEPLRNIVLRLGLFRRDYGNQFDPPAIKPIHESINDAQRMHAMVKDLLSFSNALDNPEDAESFTDATDSLREALANLAIAIQENNAELRFDVLPLLRVQRVHLTQLFQNLIGNALKYRKQDVTPIIAISAEPAGDEWIFSVVDNGIGFDPAYAKRIFGVFKRLHHYDQYPGTGIGLAICARIVAHYGGRIWAEGEPGKGATFRFRLPGQSSPANTFTANQHSSGNSTKSLAKDSD